MQELIHGLHLKWNTNDDPYLRRIDRIQNSDVYVQV